MDVKVLRFLELSSEFCKEPEDYEGFSNVATGTTCILGTSYSGTVLSTANYANIAPHLKLEQFKNQKQSEIEKAERWEEFLNQKQSEIEKAERWEEFLELKNDLKQYLEAKIKLTK